jgi:hypothetical protein
MAKVTRFVGMDGHAETIAVAIAEGRDVRSLGTIPSRPDAVVKLIKKLGDPASLRVCYEAGPTGYVLYWQLTRLGAHCDVIAPSLVPKMAGTVSKPTAAMPSSSARSYSSAILPPSGSLTLATSRCATWFVLARPPKRTSCEVGTVWASTCCVTVSDLAMAAESGPQPGGNGCVT